MADDRCETCRFFHELPATEAGRVGLCRFSACPPQMVVFQAAQYYAAWPRVAPSDWCGDHEPIAKNPGTEATTAGAVPAEAPAEAPAAPKARSRRRGKGGE